ncbi:MAG: hemolysin family protein, partial [Candidatus Zixiibacteriota bacterium]
ELLTILFLILANGFFALSEFSIIASRKSKLKQQADEGKRGAVTAEKLHKNPDKFLASIQFGITLFGTLAGVFGGATIVNQLEEKIMLVPIDFISDAAAPISVGLVAITITITSIIIGELVPKYLALSNPESYARHVARPVNIFIKLSSFFSGILSNIANSIIRIFGVKKGTSGSAITEEEINLMIFEGKEKGIFDETEEKLIKSVFDFADSTVRRAMTPRTDVVGLKINTNSKEIIETIIDTGYSRYPIYENNIDHVIGVLYTKDIIVHKLNPELIVLKDLLREPFFVPDSMPLSKLLNVFKKQKKHIAVVLDEYGGTAGIVTLEDILEELVGEIQDEYDTEPEPLIKHSKTVAYAEGTVWPGAVNELMNSNLPEEKADTLAGLFINHLGRLPEKNEYITIADMKITLLEQEENRLVRLKLEKIDDTDINNTDKQD